MLKLTNRRLFFHHKQSFSILVKKLFIYRHFCLRMKIQVGLLGRHHRFWIVILSTPNAQQSRISIWLTLALRRLHSQQACYLFGYVFCVLWFGRDYWDISVAPAQVSTQEFHLKALVHTFNTSHRSLINVVNKAPQKVSGRSSCANNLKELWVTKAQKVS